MPNRKPPIPLYFTSLEIENVRCFGGPQRLDLTAGNGQPARWTLLLGDNGVGKTTLLQCLAWMRLVPDDKEPPKEPQPEGRPLAKGDAVDELPPLAAGQLGHGLQEEENEVLERLLRVRGGEKLRLTARLSFDSRLSSVGQRANGPGKIIETGVELLFNAKRELLEFAYEPKDRLRIETTFEKEFYEPVVVAYGANRQRGLQNVETGELDDPIASRRLSELTELYDVEELLSGLDYASRKPTGAGRESKRQLARLKDALATILPGDDFEAADIEISPPDVIDSGERSGVYLRRNFSGSVPLSALSLGYQTTLAWTADLAWRLLKRYPGSTDPLAEPAVVLIDEIDLHLHPLWQLRILDDIAKIFRGTQFVATSHSPLIVQVAEDANVVLLRQRETEVEIVKDPEDVRRWRVDQILTSELFGLPGARNKKTEALFTRRDELAMKSSRSAEEEAELENLRLQISELPTAQDPEDQRAMELIRKAAALLKEHKVVES